MKQFYIDNELYAESDKIIKGLDYIKGDNFEIRGIKSWTQFSLGEGQEWDFEIDQIAQLKISQAEQFETILEILGGM